MRAAVFDVIGVIFVARISERSEEFGRENFRKTDNRVERCAQLVAHGCKEL